MPIDPGILAAAIVVGLIAYEPVAAALRALGQTRGQRQARRRARRAELAAVEAAGDSPAFDPARVRQEIELMLNLVGRAWATGEDTLAGRRDQRWLSSWATEMEIELAHPELLGLVETRLVNVVNREGDAEDRVDVWVRVRMRPGSELRPRWQLGTRIVDQVWTLGRRPGGWELLRFATDPLSRPPRKRRLIPMPWADRERLHGASLRELASAEPAAIGLSDPAQEPAARVRDLALVDARYGEAVIESVLHDLVEAWEQTGLGRPQRLEELCSPRVATRLGYGRVVDPQLLDWRVVDLDDSGQPVWLTLDVYLDNAPDMRWVLESCEGSDPLWRLVGTSSPLPRLAD